MSRYVHLYCPSFCWVLNSAYQQSAGPGKVELGAWCYAEVVYYCNVLYYGIYDELIRRLQSVQNAADGYGH